MSILEEARYLTPVARAQTVVRPAPHRELITKSAHVGSFLAPNSPTASSVDSEIIFVKKNFHKDDLA